MTRFTLCLSQQLNEASQKTIEESKKVLKLEEDLSVLESKHNQELKDINEKLEEAEAIAENAKKVC